MKAYLSALHLFLIKIYGDYIEKEDLEALNEDLVKISVDLIFTAEVYRILVCLMRIDNFDADKDMRIKYSMLKGVKTTDFDIDKYLSMNDPMVVVDELSKLSGIHLESDRDMIQNPTLQNFELEEMPNIEFKEFFKNNKTFIENMPKQI